MHLLFLQQNRCKSTNNPNCHYLSNTLNTSTSKITETSKQICPTGEREREKKKRRKKAPKQPLTESIYLSGWEVIGHRQMQGWWRILQSQCLQMWTTKPSGTNSWPKSTKYTSWLTAWSSISEFVTFPQRQGVCWYWVESSHPNMGESDWLQTKETKRLWRMCWDREWVWFLWSWTC